MASNSIMISLVLGLLLIAALSHFFAIGKRISGMPPGPHTVPLLGNLHMFPRKNAYLKFTEWAREHGGIYSLMLFSRPIVIISNPRIARELFEKKNASVSDRPPTYMINLITDGKYLGLAQSPSDWRRARSVLHKSLTKEACTRHEPILQAEAIQLMYDLMTKPEQFFEHTIRYTYSVVTSILAGIRSPRSTSPLLIAYTDMLHKWSVVLEPGAQPPVDLLPILKYVPERWARWKGLCREVRAGQFELYDGFICRCERRMEQDMRNGSLLESIIDERKFGTDRALMRGTIAAFIDGGTETTAVFLKSLILMLVSSPEAQSKAQKELDSVVGSERLPVLADFAELPYVQAIVKEVLRIRPVLPTGVPYYTTKEETLDGYMIPNGSTIFVHLYGILHDSEDYEDPDIFNPDRFLRSEFGTRSGADDTGRGNETHFGGGRRVCVGMNLANNSIIINTMYFLWAFDFKEPIDSITLRPIPVDINNYSEGIATSPNPFKCDIRVRSPLHASIIGQEFHSARPVFQRYEHDLSPEDAAYVRNQ